MKRPDGLRDVLDDHRDWRNRLIARLNRRGISDAEIGDILLEVQSHIDESGESPVEAFGSPEEYARSRTVGLHTCSPADEDRRRQTQFLLFVVAAIFMAGSPLLATTRLFDMPRFLPVVGILTGFAFLQFAIGLTPRNGNAGREPVDPVNATPLMPHNRRKAIVLLISFVLVANLISIAMILFL